MKYKILSPSIYLIVCPPIPVSIASLGSEDDPSPDPEGLIISFLVTV